MARTIAAGIDIGTAHIKVVLAERIETNGHDGIRVIGTGTAESRGLRHGYITNPAETAKSIRLAVRQAEKTAGIKIRKTFLSVGGVGLAGTTAQGSIIASRADSEITDLDVKKAQEVCEHELPASASLNRKVLHAIPLGYKIDGKPVLGRPAGMKGMKLEAKMLFITCLEQHLQDLVGVLGDVGIEVEDVMASPIAESIACLTKAQKIAGCVLANIGAETVSIVVFENNIPISIEVFPIGSTNITHDIALGLRVPIEEAEKIKLGFSTESSYSKKKLDEIVLARLSDIFELIENNLKKIGRDELLPAGIIMSGGGAGLDSIDEIARLALKIPSRLAHISFESGSKTALRDTSFAIAYGLCMLGMTQSDEPSIGIKLMRGTKNNIIAWIKQFLP